MNRPQPEMFTISTVSDVKTRSLRINAHGSGGNVAQLPVGVAGIVTVAVMLTYRFAR